MLQIGTELQKEGPAIFARLKKELTEIMTAKGYTSIDEFRGKLRSLSPISKLLLKEEWHDPV